jgi:transposase-like protein
MIIIKFLGKNVKVYLSRYQDVPPSLENHCPDCDRKPYKHGRYYRTVTTRNKIHVIPIYRWYCPACGKTFSLLPDFLKPYYVYSGWILQKAWVLRYLKGKSYSNIQCMVSTDIVGGVSYKTVKRWDQSWTKNKDNLFRLLYSNLIEFDPTTVNFQTVKTIADGITILYLLQKLWKIIHSTNTLPLYGYFPWINQLINKV